MQFVFDASALLRLFLEDGPVPESLTGVMDLVETGEASFVVPELFWAETAHVLHRRQKQGLLASTELPRLWDDLSGLPARSLGHQPFMPSALKLASRYNLSVYDALYLAIAVGGEIPLLTVDDQLSKAACRLGVLVE